MSEINLATRGYVDTKFSSDALVILNVIYPVGAICLGTHPDIGTWEPFNAGGVLYADTALADGTTMTEALPNIAMSKTASELSAAMSTYSNGPLSYTVQGTTGSYPNLNNISWGLIKFDASRADATYGAAAQPGYKVQVKGTNITAWKRTA